MSVVALLFDASHAGTMMMALKKIGPKNVAIRNHFDRTRSRYSRLMIAQSLAMSAHSLLDSSRPRGCPGFARTRSDFLKKDLMQRRLDHLESLYGCPRFHDSPQQRLWIRARCHLDLEKTIGVVRALHQRVVAQYRCDSLHS